MRNITKYRGENVRIRCEISGNPLPRYKWIRKDNLLSDENRRINVKNTPWGSR